jgi:hypothetical protein
MEKVFEIQQAAWNLDIASKSKLVLLNILWRYNYLNSKAAFPSQSRIAKDTGLSVRTVKRALDDLVSLGLLTRKVNKNNGQANEYTPDFEAITANGHLGLGGRSQWPTGVGHSGLSTMNSNYEKNYTNQDIKKNEEVESLKKSTPSLRSGVEPQVSLDIKAVEVLEEQVFLDLKSVEPKVSLDLIAVTASRPKVTVTLEVSRLNYSGSTNQIIDRDNILDYLTGHLFEEQVSLDPKVERLLKVRLDQSNKFALTR